MAPPPNRRSGYSRRAQYGTFFGYIAGIVGALIGGGFLIVSILDNSTFAPLRGAAADVAAPAGRVVAGGRAGGQTAFEVLRGYIFAGTRMAKLERELAGAKSRLVQAQATAEENARLKALLGLAQEDPRPVAVARLVAATGSSSRRFATLGAGAADGVAVGMPVRTPVGLVGRVLEVSSTSSRVLLATDSESVVPVRRAYDGVAGFAQGRGDGQIQLRLINLGINPLKKGDVFVTSGSGGLYRPGTPLATVVELTRDGAVARVLADPSAAEFVAVERVWTPPAMPSAQTAASPAPSSSASSQP
jgi:rod shape-determining protein MreC